MGKYYDGCVDGGIVGIVVDVFDECVIDFDEVDW